MMVTGLQLPFQSSPLDGMSAKIQSMDSGINQPLSFGEILKAKEKQLQQEQEVSASSVAAALAASQTLPIATPSTPDVETKVDTAKVDTQSDGKTSVSDLKPLQISTPASLDVLPQHAANMIGTINLPEVAKAVTELSLSTELPFSVSEQSQNIQAELMETISAQSTSVEETKIAATNLPKPETPIYKNPQPQAMPKTAKTVAKSEAILEELNRLAADIHSDTTASLLGTSVIGTKNVDSQSSTSDLQNMVPSVDTKNETGNIAVPSDLRTFTNLTLSSQPLPDNFSKSQAEPEDVKSQNDAISQPKEVSSFPAYKEVVVHSKGEYKVDRFVSPSGYQGEVSEQVLAQPFADTLDANQKTIPIAVEKVEKFINIADPTVEFSDETSPQDSSDQPVRDQAITSINSRQVDKLVNTITSKTEVANTILIQKLPVQNQFEQAEQPVDSPAPAIQSQDATFAQYFTAQPITHQKENSFTSEKPKEYVTLDQYLVDQLGIDRGTVAYTHPQETLSSNSLATGAKNSTIDLEIPLSSLSSPIKAIEMKTEKVVKQTVGQAETPTIKPMQSTNDFLPTQIETEQPNNVPEAKTAEMEADKPRETAPFLQSITEPDQNAETNQAESAKRLQQGEVNNTKVNTNVRHEIEQIVTQGPVQTKTSASTADQAGIKLTVSQIGADDVNLIVEKTTVKIEPTETLQPAINPESINRVIGSAEVYQVETLTRISLSEISSSILDTNISQEIGKFSQQPVPNLEIVESLTPQDLSEIPLSNSTMVAEDISETKQIETDNHSQGPVVNEPDNAEKAVQYPVTHSETVATNLTRHSSYESPDLSVVNQKTTNKQAINTVTGTETLEQTPKVRTEIKPLPVNITDLNNKTGKAVSPSTIYTEADESSKIKDFPGVQPSNNLGTYEETTNNFEQADAPKENVIIPVIEFSLVENEKVHRAAVSARSFVSPAADADSVDFVTETFVPPLSTKPDLVTTDSAEASQDRHSGNLVKLEKIMVQTGIAGQAVEVMQPKVASPDSARISPIQTSDSASEEPELQHSEPLPLSQSIPHNGSPGFNAKLENDAETIATQTIVTHIQETNSILNQSATDVLAAPVTAKGREFPVESMVTKPQANTNISSTKIPQPEIETSGVAQDLTTIKTTDHLENVVLSEMVPVADHSVNEDILQGNNVLHPQQSFHQSNEVAGVQTTISSVQETTVANQPAVDIVNASISAEHKEVADIYEEKVSTNILSAEIALHATGSSLSTKDQSTVTISSDLNDVKTQTAANVEEMTIDPDRLLVDDTYVPLNAKDSEIKAQQKSVKPQAEVNTSLPEILQSVLEASSVEKNILTIATNSKIETQTSSNRKEAPVDRVQPAINSVETSRSTENEDVMVGSKIVKPQQGEYTFSTEIRRSRNDNLAFAKGLEPRQIEDEISEIEPQNGLRSEEITISQDEAQPNIHPLPEDTAAFEAKTVLAQEDKSISPAEIQQPATATTFATKTNMGSEMHAGVEQSITPHAKIGEALPWSANDLPMTQTTVVDKESVFESGFAGQQVNTPISADRSRSNSGVPIEGGSLSKMSTEKAETRDQTTSFVKQMELLKTSSSEAQPAKSPSDTAKTKNVEKQVTADIPTTVREQIISEPVEKANVANDLDIEKSGFTGIFTKTKENFDQSHTTVIGESKISNGQVPLSSLSEIETSSDSRPKVSIKTETGKKELKANPILFKDEETVSVEKQPKQNQTLGSAAASIGSGKETSSIGSNMKASTDQIDAQAAEVTQQVIHQMNVRIKNGPTSMHLQLSPKDLGNIDVEMVSTSQGVHVTFFAEQANTGKLLETQLNQLRESLIDSGVQLSGLNITQHGLSEQKGGFSHNTSFAQESSPDFIRNETNDTEVLHSERTTGHLGEVDYRI